MTARSCSPSVALFDDETIAAEAEQGRSRDCFDGTVRPGDRRSPVDGASAAHDHGIAESTFRPDLLGERPGDVLAWYLTGAERVRIEHGVVRVERRDDFHVACRPRARPGLYPGASRGLRVYFATSTARDSRITVTLT